MELELANTMSRAGLVDVYRVVKLHSPGYTWRNSWGDTSRLDLLFMAERMKVHTCFLTTALVFSSIEVEGCQMG